MLQSWSEKEVQEIINDYFAMLSKELNNVKYNKTIHRDLLSSKLQGRSDGSIEFKHQNISAILAEIGVPFIKGYKPRYNYQNLLSEEVLSFVNKNKSLFEKDFETFSLESKSNFTKPIDFENIVDNSVVESILHEPRISYNPIKVNYLEKEQNNRSLGELGEKLIMDYEKWRLINIGKENYADKVEWISKEKGDGAGFDILSKNENGTDRYIEVKTTKLTKETPIFLTNREVSFAESKESNFYLYRVFDFKDSPRFFIRNGKYQNYCKLKPETFKGFF